MTFNAIVTGASRGIGRAIALELATKQANLALVARHRESLLRVAEEVFELGGKAWVFPCDLTETQSLSQLIDAIAKELGQINVLINNAGAFDFTSVAEADLRTWDIVIDLNLKSVIHLTRYALPYLQQHKSSAIINIASVAGKDYVPKGAIYCASKFGLFGFSGCLFEDVRDKGIKVCTIGPGQVASRVDHVPSQRTGFIPPQDIAKIVLFVLEFPGTSCPTEILVRAQNSP